MQVALFIVVLLALYAIALCDPTEVEKKRVLKSMKGVGGFGGKGGPPGGFGGKGGPPGGFGGKGGYYRGGGRYPRGRYPKGGKGYPYYGYYGYPQYYPEYYPYPVSGCPYYDPTNPYCIDYPVDDVPEDGGVVE